ncbi:pre-mRNA-splicing factor SPF27-like [Sinocyclocheilus grahami]|uniref:pre-mRNA-splicing factor SPF27-like n=1 Tax=Sinocyclocheilus grahami TaxID=75366 RepID=UPI0007ACC85D|nr:PREDICTED: pre-mRNA-splicing factor SPF27-like [Sinocyclocheilus grahami]
MAGPASVAGDVFVDALPYFDQGYDAPGVREAAAALVEEETRRYRPTKNYLSYLPTPDFSAFETEIMRNEFERLSARQPMELLSMKRNSNLALMIENAQKELQKARKQIQDLNWQRKNDQLAGGAKLRELESNWVSLVSKNYEIERAIIQLENEVAQMKQQQGDENKENIRQDF